jgi:hypothetical protein
VRNVINHSLISITSDVERSNHRKHVCNRDIRCSLVSTGPTIKNIQTAPAQSAAIRGHLSDALGLSLVDPQASGLTGSHRHQLCQSLRIIDS